MLVVMRCGQRKPARPQKGNRLTVAAEQQPCGVQVVERVGLVALSIIL
jgi:hypothetical protein